MTRVDCDRRLYGAYRNGRALSDEIGRLCMTAVGGHLDGARGHLAILDLGAGTGRFSTLLAGRVRCAAAHILASSTETARRHRFPRLRASSTSYSCPSFRPPRAIDEARLPTVEQGRALSTLELMTDAEFHEGLERMRQAVERETAPAPVMERIDLLVLRRQAT